MLAEKEKKEIVNSMMLEEELKGRMKQVKGIKEKEKTGMITERKT